jgi:phosphorylcholine metabolism protein LicD
MEVKNFRAWKLNTVENIDRPEQHLIFTSRLLNNYVFTWYLAFGTALGFYRDKDFIPGDSDIDISIIVSKDTPFAEISREMEKQYSFIRSVEHEGIQQLAFQTEDGFIIDLSFYRKEGDKYITRHEEGNYADEVDVIGDTISLKTKYGYFPIPEKIEEYLVGKYADWKTPRYGATTSAIRV